MPEVQENSPFADQPSIVIKLCNAVIEQAIHNKENRVVIESTAPIPPAKVVYLRLVEEDHPVMVIPGNLHQPFVLRLMTMAGLDPAVLPDEQKSVQGSFETDLQGKKYTMNLIVLNVSG